MSNRTGREAALAAWLCRGRDDRDGTEGLAVTNEDFLASAAHELRSPLSAIRGWADVLSRENIDSATIARAANAIQRNVVAQARVIDERLERARLIQSNLNLDAQRGVFDAVTDAFLELALDSIPIDPAHSFDNAHALRGVDIVLVDDNEDGRDVVTLILRTAGARVHAFAQADAVLAALSALRARHPDAVLVSDIAMPEVDGYALIESIRAGESRAGTARMPAYALTAHSSIGAREAAQRAGFDGYFVKPITPRVLVDALTKHVPLPAGKTSS